MELTPDFILIPYQLIKDNQIDSLAKHLYGVIYWLTQLKLDKCIASNKTFAKTLRSSPQAISNALTALERRGYITRVYSDPKKRIRAEIRANIAFSSIPQKGGLHPQVYGVTPIGEQSNNTYKENTGEVKTSRPIKGNKHMKYNERASSDSYEPAIDSESRESTEVVKPKAASLMDAIKWAENERGSKFLNLGKQIKALAVMKKNHISSKAIINRWKEMQSDDYWRAKGFDFMDMLNSFDKKR